MVHCVIKSFKPILKASYKTSIGRSSESFFHRLPAWLRWSSRRRGLMIRFFLCWGLGLLALSTDEANRYDTRFDVRGPQKVNSDIVVILLKQSDFSKFLDRRTNAILNVNELTDITDSFFWDKKTWSRFLSTLLNANPKSILVTLYFGNNIGSESLTTQENILFKDHRIFWSTSVNNMERLTLPLMTLPDRSNIGTLEVSKDEDGFVRRIYTMEDEEVPTLVERGSFSHFPNNTASFLINYRGPNVFPVYSLSEVLEDNSLQKYLKNKIIVVGSENSVANQFQTPVGPLSKAEITAHIADNLTQQRWIKKWPTYFYALYFLFLLFLALLIMKRYSQQVSAILFFFVGLSALALSVYIFDSFYLWLPAVSPSIMLVITWVIFVGHQAMKIEQAHFRLQQEKKYLEELEQLKNNFVSLISHDLKTPIAKIQAVVDRLMTQEDHRLESDLKSLRRYSDELNRYIQSILKVLRVESRDFKLNLEVGDINEIIVEAITMLRPLASEKNIKLETQLEPLFSQEFDAILIKEVIINLIENAIKYTPQGGGEILISSRETETHVVVSVKDHGEGISAEDLKHVWGKFVRGKDQDLKSKGTGLGLYLVKYFIELHGGQIELNSELKKGTEVIFSLPLAPNQQ